MLRRSVARHHGMAQSAAQSCSLAFRPISS
jgi:hypothetical protein